MHKNTLFVSTFAVLLTAAVLAEEAPLELAPAVILDVHSTAAKKSNVRYYGQPAKDGMIDLTATNGFFDRCFEAIEPQPAKTKNAFIAVDFKSLRRLSDQVSGTARWHLWCAKAGEFQAKVWMKVPAGEAGHEWTIRVGEETQILRAAASDGTTPQAQSLTFKVKEPGRVTFVIDCTKQAPPAETELHYIRLQGAAIDGASLLRTRWRPAAVHTHFYAPAECPEPRMWVFESRSVSKTSSYSPLTTGFGYYGTLFNGEGRIAPGAAFNFSMWAANGTATAAPPLERMPRLIGTDIAAAKFSTFGGEGTGVKFRDATAYPNGAERTIQALRIAPTKDGLLTYYGYYFDESAARWRLYASAQTAPKNAKAAQSPNFGLLGDTGSFCEIPGPPARERSGDVVREIMRRGWFYGKNQQWYRASLENPAPNRAKPAAKDADDDDAGSIANKRAYYLDNFGTDGWMAMSTGGIEYHIVDDKHKLPKTSDNKGAQPEYLSVERTKQLFALPVEFGECQASSITTDSATVECPLRKTGPNSQATLYYGTVDCLTYPAQVVTRGSPVEIEMASPARTWQTATPPQPANAGANKFQLAGLKKQTTYYYRIYVEHDQGKSWDYQSGSFTTK